MRNDLWEKLVSKLHIQISQHQSLSAWAAINERRAQKKNGAIPSAQLEISHHAIFLRKVLTTCRQQVSFRMTSGAWMGLQAHHLKPMNWGLLWQRLGKTKLLQAPLTSRSSSQPWVFLRIGILLLGEASQSYCFIFPLSLVHASESPDSIPMFTPATLNGQPTWLKH